MIMMVGDLFSVVLSHQGKTINVRKPNHTFEEHNSNILIHCVALITIVMVIAAVSSLTYWTTGVVYNRLITIPKRRGNWMAKKLIWYN